MSGKTILVIVLIPLAVAVPVVLVKMVVKDVDPMLPPELLRHYEVVTAEYYGVRLDEKASPRDVVHVLMRSVQEGLEKAEAPTGQEQSEGVRRTREIQLALAAPNTIVGEYVRQRYPVKTERARRKLVLHTVLSWGRTLGFYADSIGLTPSDRKGWQESVDRSDPNGPARATIHFTAQRDDSETRVIVNLARESNRWRIHRVFLAPAMPTIPDSVLRAVTRPATSKATTAPAVTTKPKATKPPTQPSVKVQPKPAVVKPAAPPAKPTVAPKPKPAPPAKPTVAPKPKPAPPAKPAAAPKPKPAPPAKPTVAPKPKPAPPAKPTVAPKPKLAPPSKPPPKPATPSTAPAKPKPAPPTSSRPASAPAKPASKPPPAAKPKPKPKPAPAPTSKPAASTAPAAKGQPAPKAPGKPATTTRAAK